MGAAKRYNRGFAVMYLDLDEFKEINDSFGHPMGDLVLKAVADRLVRTLRESDTVARFGGDEFVILQPVVNGPADAADLARKIVGTMQVPLEIEGVRTVTCIRASASRCIRRTAEPPTNSWIAPIARSIAPNTPGRNRWEFFTTTQPRRGINPPAAQSRRRSIGRR